MALSQSGKQTSEHESSLDIDDESLRELSASFVGLVTDCFAKAGEGRVFPETTGEEIKAKFAAAPPPQRESLRKILDDCGAVIDGSRHNGHPRFFGYVASPATPAGAFADLLASTLNASVTSWRSAPAPTEVERTVVRWLGSLIGFDDQAEGLLTSGGSMANLNALLIAHRVKAEAAVARIGIRGTSVPMTIYASDQIHLSITKA